ncbi:glycosyltransferase [Natrinema versiforme]|uniref:Glycosyl transferase group 1 n=1 Tax=Natrinema versiforme JCM 10478 TaxID=1227496 RepID=L9Y0A1_9EURY|nr:glycosyltransferase [Natrinema versiforme]ELY67470.1 glycosyl transferase group 1 [Natrinema versiforme JCM 10478]
MTARTTQRDRDGDSRTPTATEISRTRRAATSDRCLLYQNSDAHPAHRVFADAVSADRRHFETGSRPPEPDGNTERTVDRLRTAGTLPAYDTVIAEGSAPLQTGLAYKLRHPGTTLVYLAADETFYTLSERPTRFFWRGLKPLSSRLLDGVIAVGRDAYRWGRPYLGDVPVAYVRPPIGDEKYERLAALSPNSPADPFTILTAGEAKPANGYDRLARAVDRFAGTVDADVRLVILGEGHEAEAYAEESRVVTPGFVDLDTFADWFGRASVYVQSSRGDAFPVAALEGILSGTPTIVTAATGVRGLLPARQVVPPTEAGLFDGLATFADLSPAERRSVASDQRDLVTNLTESNQRDRFSAALERFT